MLKVAVFPVFVSTAIMWKYEDLEWAKCKKMKLQTNDIQRMLSANVSEISSGLELHLFLAQTCPNPTWQIVGLPGVFGWPLAYFRRFFSSSVFYWRPSRQKVSVSWHVLSFCVDVWSYRQRGPSAPTISAPAPPPGSAHITALIHAFPFSISALTHKTTWRSRHPSDLRTDFPDLR